MDRLAIECASCGRQWLAALPFSVHEQQALESCPCPHCGAYTVCCQEPACPAVRRSRSAARPEPAH